MGTIESVQAAARLRDTVFAMCQDQVICFAEASDMFQPILINQKVLI